MALFSSYIAIERLTAALHKPDDQALLYSLIRQHEKHEQAGLSVIWAFAMTKAGAMKQTWYLGSPWHLKHAEKHPDGFFSDPAYQSLESCLETQDKLILRRFLDHNVRMSRPEARLWAMWQFAMAKGQESSWEWREHLDRKRQREMAEENARG